MSLKVFYEKDSDLSIIKSKKVGIIGYGSQAHAHAQNLKDSGVNVVVGLRDGSSSIQKAVAAGLKVVTPSEVAKSCDVIMVLIPDELQKELYAEIADHIKLGSVLLFAHGFSVHFGYVSPKDGISIGMVAPKGPGHTVRSEFLKNGGVPCLIAPHRDATADKSLHKLLLSYALAIGGAKSGVIETTFKDECETDLFGEQAVLCGGLIELMRAGFETLVEAGYPQEMAYFECVHELKLIIDLIYEGGIANMMYSISNTAEYGAYVSGKEVIDPKDIKVKMKEILHKIQTGEFARKWMLEASGSGSNVEKYKNLKQWRSDLSHQSIEHTGEKLRALMPWIAKNKLVDKQKN